MSDKEIPQNTNPEITGDESILDFEEAKDLTIGQAMRKSAEIEAGVTEQDSVLDKYIKQHREEIVAGKFDTVHQTGEAGSTQITLDSNDLRPTSLDDFIKEVRSESTEESPQLVEEPVEEVREEKTSDFDQIPIVEMTNPDENPSHQSNSQETVTSEPQNQPVFTSQVRYQWDNEPFYKRKGVIYTSLAVLALLIGGSAIYWGMTRNNGTTTPNTSQTSSEATTSGSLSEEETNKKSFDDLYATFFTDGNQTALKNSAFGNLESLKAILDKLQGTASYDAAKQQYDNLVKQVSAIQTVNGQFTTAAITDGVLDINAQAKSDAVFADTTTGNAEIDKVLNQAVEQGRSQVAQASAANQATSQQATTPAVSAAPTTVPENTATQTSSGEIQNAGVPGFGLSSLGVNLQRNLSRVPYNQDAINDTTNPAWNFNPGILEKILQTSRERGYITGDNYILEKVNIINGNGYYNLFKPDGTYLFSINAKTGYFVGNARGNADALDY
ncbi:hypothetical protein STRDD10_00082 [Streptococcus sp. DD10]|uniref:cell division site-positioning protein MapZ family protein n=1 Tax=Streptococcus sp. DD10 TaxID=1777878 RepID=UPI00079380C8|nr:cell division site-positioning protein MapZ family protein [Streptococcus sp. DD10]KXT77169.1 hypothetical protein STRDD10_00082 [Streptococcus sp. DD10]